MVNIKTYEEIEKMRVANRIVAKTLVGLKELVREGTTTLELDKAAEEMIRGEGANPSFKGYRGFPNSLCASVNGEVVHGIPSGRKLKDGDIISLDLGTEVEGYYGDAAVTYPVGQSSDEAEKLMLVTQEALYEEIRYMREGNRLSDISNAIQTHAEAA